jgi:hypothetical protein
MRLLLDTHAVIWWVDRLLIAQALVEEVPIVSADTTLEEYGVTRIWRPSSAESHGKPAGSRGTTHVRSAHCPAPSDWNRPRPW